MKTKNLKPEILEMKGRVSASQRFMIFQLHLLAMGVAPISPEREARDLKIQRVVPPKSPRIPDLVDQVIFDREVDGITLRVPTTYVHARGAFMRRGKLWVRLVQKGADGREPGILTWKTPRVGDFLVRTRNMVQFLVSRLELRPADSRGELMELREQIGKDREHPFIWVGKDHHGKEETKSFFDRIPIKLLDFVMAWRASLWYYETVVRQRQGYQARERNIRLPYRVEKKPASPKIKGAGKKRRR